jgi:uncharacterized membrane protein
LDLAKEIHNGHREIKPMNTQNGNSIGIDIKKRRETLRETGQQILDRLKGTTVSRNTNVEFDDQRTFGERVADQIAQFGGSWTFIITFLIILAAWIITNSYVLAHRDQAFDPYPYILLNLFLSMLAAIQAPVIMMSQNRQAEKDRLDAAHDYEVNLKSELEIASLHEKLDEFREQKWRELIAMQEQQIQFLERLIESARKV